MNRLITSTILGVYLVVAALYSVVTPIFEASDELWHYPLVRELAHPSTFMQLPVQVPGVLTPWRQEGSQPPLYYMMAAVLTAWIDTSDFDEVRVQNPHADIGIIVPDGNFNIMIHDFEREAFPRFLVEGGTVFAVHIVRLFSVLLGAITVVMTYRLARELFPLRPGVAYLAMAFVAFNPMFLFISGSVNNDNLSTALASILLVEIARLLKRADAPPTRDLVLIGVVAGAGMLAKFNIGFLLPIIALALLVNAIRLWNNPLHNPDLHNPDLHKREAIRTFVKGALITGTLTIVISAWWYIRNVQLYGDPTGLNVFLDIVGRRPIPANAAQLWSERHTFLMSYWGFFGGVNLALQDWIYTVFNALALIGVIGAVVYPILPKRRKKPAPENAERRDSYFDETPLDDSVSVPGDVLLARVICILWIVVLFVGLLRWTGETWASQGRLMFSAIAPISIVLAVGLSVLPRGLIWLMAAWHFGVATYGLILIQVAYTNPYFVPSNVAGEQRAYMMEPAEAFFAEPGAESFGIGLSVVRDVQPLEVGTYAYLPADVRFYPEYLSRDWTVFVHLRDENDVIVAQRDVFPIQGTVATSRLSEDDLSNYEPRPNLFAVRVPDYALAPAQLSVYLGLYDRLTGERMIDTNTGDDELFVGTIQIEPRLSDIDVPNPVRMNFGNQAELIGYEVSRTAVQQGEPLKVTLYWRAIRPMTTDYRVFVQVLQPDSTNVFARSDGMPAAWTRPTSTWRVGSAEDPVGEIIVDEHTLIVPNDAPPGMWQLRVGMYELIEQDGTQEFRRLRAIYPDGSQPLDYLDLTRIRFDLADPF